MKQQFSPLPGDGELICVKGPSLERALGTSSKYGLTRLVTGKETMADNSRQKNNGDDANGRN